MTGQELFDLSLIDLGVISAGQSPTTTESTNGLTILNSLIESLSAEALPLYQITREAVAMTGGSPYTLSTRPMLIKSAAYTNANVITPYEVVTNEIWSEGIRNNVLFYDGGYPTGTFRVRPDPSAGSMELYELRQLATIASLTTAIALPPGYERALRLLLARELTPSYAVPDAIAARVAQLAEDAKTSILGLNQAVLGPIPGVARAPSEVSQ